MGSILNFSDVSKVKCSLFASFLLYKVDLLGRFSHERITISVFNSGHSISVKVGNRYNSTTSLFYHPQRSWGKVIFSEASVKNSVHRVSRPRPRSEVEGSGLGGGGV